MEFGRITHAAMRANGLVRGFEGGIRCEILCRVGLGAAGLAGVVKLGRMQR